MCNFYFLLGYGFEYLYHSVLCCLSHIRYTSKMLLAAIDENHRGTYDFLYLPIDFKVILCTNTDASAL